MTDQSPSVLTLLSDRSGAYVRRVPPDGRASGEWSRPLATGVSIDDGWSVEAVVTVDPEGRIPWRLHTDRAELTGVSLVLRDRMVEVQSCDDSTAGRRPDRQGRLHLPRGLLKAIGVDRGDRLAIVRSEGRRVLGLVSTRRLAVRS